mgnify:FL=1
MGEIGFRILREIETQGRRHPLAQFQNLVQWLQTNYPGVKAELLPEFPLNVNIWRIIILTADGKFGVAVPALDAAIGFGSAVEWFEGGRYDGAQSLVRRNIGFLAIAGFNRLANRWIAIEKGRIINLD